MPSPTPTSPQRDVDRNVDQSRPATTPRGGRGSAAAEVALLICLVVLAAAICIGLFGEAIVELVSTVEPK